MHALQMCLVDHYSVHVHVLYMAIGSPGSLEPTALANLPSLTLCCSDLLGHYMDTCFLLRHAILSSNCAGAFVLLCNRQNTISMAMCVYREFSRNVTSCMTTVSFSVYVRFCPPCVGDKWKLE